MADHSRIVTLFIEDDGRFPGNALPVLLYRQAVTFRSPDPARDIEALFTSNGWTDTWRNGIFDFHHYHATAHEVLGCSRGWVLVQLGGPSGTEVRLEAGDVAVLPAGTAHKNLEDSGDYQIIGAYPPGQSVDMRYGDPGERPAADHEISNVALPRTDPVHGSMGPLLEEWKVR